MKFKCPICGNEEVIEDKNHKFHCSFCDKTFSKEDLSSLEKENKEFHDRYYKLTSKTSNQVILEPFQIGCQISRIADLFFAENPVYIENSILSRFQKNFYYNRLKRIFETP